MLTGRGRDRPYPRSSLLLETSMKFIQNLKLGTRLALGFGLVLFVLAVIAALAAIEIGRVNDNVTYFTVNTVPSLKTVATVRMAMQDLRRAEASHIMARSEAGMNEVEQAIAQSRAKLEAALKG